MADANEIRDWRIYSDFAQVLIHETRRLYVDDDFGLDIAGAIPEDNDVYEYDLNGRPTIEIPEDNQAVQAAFEIFDKIIP